MKTGHSGSSARKSGLCGTFNSSTMMVMMMAITPSLKASRRFLPIQCLAGGVTSILELVPINPHVDEAEDVAHEHRPQGDQDFKVRAVRDFEFQHHDGDDDGDDASLKTSSRFLPIVDSLIFPVSNLHEHRLKRFINTSYWAVSATVVRV